jgi:hypothetical protein
MPLNSQSVSNSVACIASQAGVELRRYDVCAYP